MKLTAMLLPAFVLSALLVSGCGTMKGGNTIVKYDQGSPPITTSVTSSGTYALYSMTDYNPQVVVQLKEGDQLGFKSAQTGQVTAVAGDREIPLEANKTYYWKRQ